MIIQLIRFNEAQLAFDLQAMMQHGLDCGHCCETAVSMHERTIAKASSVVMAANRISSSAARKTAAT